jgi:hypothetical protein
MKLTTVIKTICSEAWFGIMFYILYFIFFPATCNPQHGTKQPCNSLLHWRNELLPLLHLRNELLPAALVYTKAREANVHLCTLPLHLCNLSIGQMEHRANEIIFITSLALLSYKHRKMSKGLKKGLQVAALVKINCCWALPRYTAVQQYFSCAHGVTLPLVSLRFKTD